MWLHTLITISTKAKHRGVASPHDALLSFYTKRE